MRSIFFKMEIKIDLRLQLKVQYIENTMATTITTTMVNITVDANRKPNAISLFSGCGGDTLGLENAGFSVIAFNEFKQWAKETHLANFPHSVSLTDSKGKSDITKLPDSVFEEFTGDTKIDVVFAGFPCQGFSTAGKKNTTDPRNQLFRQFVRVVKITKPSFLIGENVSGLLSMKSGPRQEDPLMIEIIREAFREIGYTISYRVLEAVRFGVPQSRKRILIVGWLSTLSVDSEKLWDTILEWGTQRPMVSMDSFIQKTLEGAHKLDARAIPPDFDTVAVQIPDNVSISGSPHSYVTLKATSFGETYNEKTYDRLLSCGKRDSPIHSEVLNVRVPCKTIICTYDHQPRLLVGLKNTSGSYVRCLLPDELKQIQGFPGNFQLKGTAKEQIIQVGNAVPPPLVEGIARQLLLLLKGFRDAAQPVVVETVEEKVVATKRRVLKKKATQ